MDHARAAGAGYQAQTHSIEAQLALNHDIKPIGWVFKACPVATQEIVRCERRTGSTRVVVGLWPPSPRPQPLPLGAEAASPGMERGAFARERLTRAKQAPSFPIQPLPFSRQPASWAGKPLRYQRTLSRWPPRHFRFSVSLCRRPASRFRFAVTLFHEGVIVVRFVCSVCFRVCSRSLRAIALSRSGESVATVFSRREHVSRLAHPSRWRDCVASQSGHPR